MAQGPNFQNYILVYENWAVLLSGGLLRPKIPEPSAWRCSCLLLDDAPSCGPPAACTCRQTRAERRPLRDQGRRWGCKRCRRRCSASVRSVTNRRSVTKTSSPSSLSQLSSPSLLSLFYAMFQYTLSRNEAAVQYTRKIQNINAFINNTYTHIRWRTKIIIIIGVNTASILQM